MQLLVSAMNSSLKELVEKMNITSSAIVVNQCDRNGYEEMEVNNKNIKCYSFAEKGVGLSRNMALLRASEDISLFSDEDIVYYDGYEEKVEEEFRAHQEADLILFNFEVCEERRTYFNEEWKQVHWYNCGRYPTFSFAFRTDRIHEKNITFSLLFGGGAKYSNGEDSLFLKECIQKGLRVYASPVVLGREVARPSTWFQGYNEKFFFDRGVLYKHLYGKMAKPLGMRFLLRHQKIMCQQMSFKECYQIMKKGMKSVHP